MHFQFDVGTPLPPFAGVVPESTSDTSDLLRQILEVQREQLAQMRATAAAHDTSARWRSLVNRWREDFPDLLETCRDVLPILERSYGGLIAELADHLRQSGNNALDNDFALQEFLDRYGMKLSQLGTILNLVAPLAEAGSQSESS